MKAKFLFIPVIMILSAFTLIGCIGVDNDFREVKSLVMNSTNEKYYKDVEFAVGPLGLSLARFIVNINDDDEEAKIILSNISEVQIGVYKKRNLSNKHYNYSFFKDIDARLRKENWHFIVKHVDRNELTGIYVKYQDENINKLYVINIEYDKLSLVRVEGDLENIVTYAIRDKGFDKVSFR